MGQSTSSNLCTGRRPRTSLAEKKKILIVNDDGVFAPGLRCLVKNLCKRLGDYNDVAIFVLAPDRERSASSHSVTTRGSLTAVDVTAKLKASFASPNDGSHCLIAAYSLTGLPVDCAQLALEGTLFESDTPFSFDLCISGINLGHNAGTNVTYSGTLGAAREAALRGVPSLAVSLDIHSSGSKVADAESPFEHAAILASDIAHELVRGGLAATPSPPKEQASGAPPSASLWNINVPKVEAGKASARHPYPGVWLTRQSAFRIVAQFQLERTTANGIEVAPYIGAAVRDDALGTDTHALERGWVSVTPILADVELQYGCSNASEMRLRSMAEITRKLAHRVNLALRVLDETTKA